MKLKVDLKYALLLLFVTIGTFAMAQRTVTGNVTDAETKEPLIGASVIVVGTSTGTVTDFEGNYTLDVPQGATELQFSYTGYATTTQTLGVENVIDVQMSAGTDLDEVVVTGYGSQKEKEITSSVVEVTTEDFNKGVISDPAQLLQGKVAGLQVYNRGGNPNQQSTIRLRGLSTVGANVQPLVVVDGIIGASLQNVDPNDIESVSVLKDGSAAAIYGSRGSSGVIIVTTKKGKASQKLQWTYNGQVGVESTLRTVEVLSPSEFVDAGGTNLGSETDWIDEVTEAPISHTHGIAVSGGIGENSSFRASANIREENGILRNTGFDQFNTRLNFSSRVFNDRLKIDFNTSYTHRDQNNGYDEALRYAVLYNPTAPILGDNSPFPFNSAQFGGFFETLGLFDSFNPVSIVEQNRNVTERREFNYGANFSYDLMSNLSLNFRIAQQRTDIATDQYAPTTANFRGNATSPIRKGLAEFYESNSTFTLLEGYATYLTSFGKSDLTVTAGYSYQQDNFDDKFFSLGDFPNDDLDFSNLIESSQDLQNAGFIAANSSRSPDNKIIAFFGRANYTFDNAIFLNASVRREGSSKLGEDNKWGIFPAFGVGVDVNRYLNLGGVDLLKVRVGYGVTGSLPQQSGLAQEVRTIVNDGQTGAVSTELARAANPDLQWEEKAEINLGVEFTAGRFSATLDLYNRDITDFILSRQVDAAVFGVDTRFENAGKLNTQGVELALNYDVVQKSNFTYNTGIILSTYETVLEEYVLDAETRGNLGAPGQNGTNMILVRVGDEIGNIWGPVFESVDETGSPVFQDVNGDGMLVTAQDNALDPDADFAVLGNGIPDLELGWTNQIQIGDWSINAFFRGAFGHSLVNTFRAFYEPRLSTQTSYNFVTTDKAVDGLTTARFSSLYVEKADFFKLDNLTISRQFNFENSNSIRSIQVSLIVQNAFVITGYSGTDPEPNFIDTGAEDNGFITDPNDFDVLAPGIDRRNNYFSARSVALGVQFNF